MDGAGDTVLRGVVNQIAGYMAECDRGCQIPTPATLAFMYEAIDWLNRGVISRVAFDDCLMGWASAYTTLRSEMEAGNNPSQFLECFLQILEPLPKEHRYELRIKIMHEVPIVCGFQEIDLERLRPKLNLS